MHQHQNRQFRHYSLKLLLVTAIPGIMCIVQYSTYKSKKPTLAETYNLYSPFRSSSSQYCILLPLPLVGYIHNSAHLAACLLLQARYYYCLTCPFSTQCNQFSHQLVFLILFIQYITVQFQPTNAHNCHLLHKLFLKSLNSYRFQTLTGPSSGSTWTGVVSKNSSSSSIGTTTLSWVSACSTVVEHSRQEGFTECRCQRHVKPPTWRRT
jgi:hypothetical protein